MAGEFRRDMGRPANPDGTYTFKVRLATTYASYWFIDAKDQDEAYEKAMEKMSEPDFYPESEASHIHNTAEVEEAI